MSLHDISALSIYEPSLDKLDNISLIHFPYFKMETYYPEGVTSIIHTQFSRRLERASCSMYRGTAVIIWAFTAYLRMKFLDGYSKFWYPTFGSWASLLHCTYELVTSAENQPSAGPAE